MSSSFWRLILMIASALVLLCMIGLLLRKPRNGRLLLVNALTGLATLWIFSLTLPAYLGLTVPINLLSLAISGVLGIPGAALAVALTAAL